MKLLQNNGPLFAFAGMLIGTTISTDALGQTDRILEEIVVTAAYREQGLQDVPVSISMVTGEKITESALQKAEDIQFLVPNFTLTETGIGTNAFIRGIGSGINQAFEQSVGTYVDGVYFGRAQQWRAPYLDLERIEVLRGPQSILFGKNSVAGAVNITTAKPGDEFEASLFASQEMEFNETIVEGILSGPISDRFRARLAARSRDGDGHMRNATLNNDEPNREDWNVRATLEFDVTENLLATFKAEMGEFDVRGRNIEVINELPIAAGPFAGLQYNQVLQIFGGDPSTGNVVKDGIRSSNGDFSNNELNNFVLTLDWDIGEYQFKSITALSEFDYDEFCDCDYTGTNLFGAALQESYDQFSQEFRLASPVGGTIDYIVGLYYQTSDHDYADQIIVTADSALVPIVNALNPGAGDLLAGTQAARAANVDADVLSAFAQVNFNITDKLTIQAGGRVTQDDRDGDRTMVITADDGSSLPAPQAGSPIVYGGLFGITSTNLSALADLGVPEAIGLTAALGELPVNGSRDTTKFSPEVKLIFDSNDNVMLYASWSEGFKSGSFDFRANNRNFYPTMEDSFEFDDEEASNIEFGGKFILGNGSAELNAALYFTEFDDLQISIFDGVLGFNVGNAASAEVQGAELDFRWAMTDRLTVYGGLAYTDFEFTDFRNGQCYFGRPPDVDIDNDGTPELCDYTGESNQLVSKWQGNVTFDYSRPVFSSLRFGMAVDYFFTSKYDASATFDPALVQNAYGSMNYRLSLGSDSGSWQLAFLARNITDNKILSFGGDTPLASTLGAKSNYAFFGQGRSYTVQGLLRF